MIVSCATDHPPVFAQSTFVEDTVKVEHARDYGHTHLSEVKILVPLSDIIDRIITVQSSTCGLD